jgi:serine-type D-Ala-D-Ala carboxypeptidase/endopeptidase (penicillin-binding protein 4)
VVEGGPKAHAAVSAANLKSGLARQLRRSGGKGGAWVGDPVTGRTLFSSGASKPFQIASNMKAFTTAAALAALGPNERFETRLIADGELEGGVLAGDLLLVGGGDPSLTAQGIGRLADRARAAGLDRVKGRLLYDESLFDRKRTVRQQGISGGPFVDLGRLSGLAYEGGRSTDPARSAAATTVSALRRRGVQVGAKTAPGEAADKPAPADVVAEVTSSSLAALSRSTNTFSINYYAEMILKGLAAAERGRGTTRGGVSLVTAFAREADASLRTQNGSGLSRADVASPRSVGALLASMLSQPAPVRDAFLDSLAVAGGTGTLAGRMRGTAAQGNCIGKTGTLSAVSALSGYCEVAPGRFVVFSILMQRVDIGRAHVAQDRMTSLIARYNP